MLPIIRFKPVCLIALLLLAAGAPGCEMTTGPEANSSRQHPKMDAYLNKLVAGGEAPDRRYVKEGFIPDKSVGVSVDISGDIETVAAWLESKGISQQDSSGRYEWIPCRLAALKYCIVPSGGADYIVAYLTLDLLAPLAQQPGVALVRAVEPYPNLTRSFRELAARFDGPLEPAEDIAARAELQPATQEVYICLSAEPDAAIAWLESNGVYADRRLTYSRPPEAILSRLATSVAEMPPDPELESLLESTLAERPEPRYGILTATVPVSLLGDLSMQKGIHRVRSRGCDGPEGGAEGPPGSPIVCPLLEGCNPPFAEILELGQSETFLLFTNVANPPGVRIGVNYEGDTGKLAIGGCLDGNSSTFVGHGDSIAIYGCSEGKAQVRLHRDDELLESYDIAVVIPLN